MFCPVVKSEKVWALAALLLAFSFSTNAAIITNGWVPVFKGVDYTTAEADANEPRQHKVFAFRVDRQEPTIEFFSTPAGGPMETIGQTTTTFVNTYGVSFGINANFFSPVSTTPNDPRELIGLAISRGAIVSPFDSSRPSALITRSNQMSFITSALANYSNYWTAVSGSDRVLINGVSQLSNCVTSFCNENPRSAVGFSSNGRYIYMMVIDGRQAGWSDGATLYETGEWLRRLGAWNGLNLDGGGSTALAKMESGSAVLMNRPSGGVQRVNGNHLGVFAQSLAPVILTQPQPQTLPIGSNATFTVFAGGTTPLRYQWRFNGTNLAGATRTSLTVSNLITAHAGNYSVVVSNATSVTPSSNALLTITLPFGVANVSVQPRPSSALISWLSNPQATSQIEYGIAPGYGNLSSWETAARTNHNALLVGLVPNTNYVFRIHSQVGPNLVVSTQYAFSTDLNLIVDNPQATYSGTWTLGTSSVDKFGTSYQYTSARTNFTPTATATFMPPLATPGKYDVSIWYPQGSNRSTNSQVSIFFNGGVANASVNQQTNGGGWRLLAAGVDCAVDGQSFATIGNNTGETTGVVMADAMRWSYLTSQDIPTDGTVPGWWSGYYFGGNVNAALDPDGDGYSTYAEYVLGTDPTNFLSRLTMNIQRTPSGLLATFAPCQGGRTYELLVATNLSASIWGTLSLSPAQAGGQGSFSITNSGSLGPRFYRLSVHLTP